MDARAKSRYIHIAPRKVRRVANLIRNMDVRRALAALGVLPQRASVPLQKLLRSALANAKQRGISASALRVERITVDPGPVLKRYRPRAFGRAAMIRKRTSHVSVVLGAEKTGR